MASESKAATVPSELLNLQKEFVGLGNELQKLVSSRQQLVIQLNENAGVAESLNQLSSEAELFRTQGSALIRLDKPDAKALVDSRISMIKKELEKIEQLVKEKGNRRLEIQSEVQKLQQQNQQPQPTAPLTG